MSPLLSRLAGLAALANTVYAQSYGCSTQPELSISVSSTSPFELSVKLGEQTVRNSAVLVGSDNTSATPVAASSSGQLANGAGQISASIISPQVAKISINTNASYVGAQFTNSGNGESNFYGVWEYPWDVSPAGQFPQDTGTPHLDNAGVAFDLKGLGNADGTNWANARAPFFFTDAGYGVYVDTLQMGSFDFTVPGEAQFIFNASSLVYYIILPSSPGDYKSILTAYADVSNTITLPPDSGYGPTFWSDNFEQDFHEGVTNAQENYYDVINHLFYNQIHASALFADRPYGTGNYSFGNFDFDPVYYPTPREFIANMTKWGFDFQVWVANRAFLDTELYNASAANGWLFPGYDPEQFLGPALNLSIPAAYEYFKQKLSVFPDLGVKGYKIDRGEEEEMPLWEQNIQEGLFSQLCAETMAEKWGEGNFYNFARNVVDQSRATSFVWNGDSHSNFTGLAYSVASGLRSGLIGFSQWGSDTGGYGRGPNDPSQELWARWMWFSTFSPMYELMLGTNHTPWYPPYTSDLVDVLKTTANLHHDLLPYIKSYTYQASVTGLPVMRAALLEAPMDSKAWDVTDAYYFGEELYVAPIITAGGQRSVYFPAGTGKYLEYFGKTSVHEAGSTCEVSLDVHSVPAYVRAGAIVPRGDIYQGNNKWTQDWQPELTVELYPSSDVPYSVFAYYNGMAKTEVSITLSMDTLSGAVTVDYGAVGTNGTFVMYTMDGMKNATLNAAGGTVTFGQIQSLFD